MPVYTYQSEADLEREFIKNLQNQGYEYLIIHNEKELIVNFVIFTSGEIFLPLSSAETLKAGNKALNTISTLNIIQ